MLQIGLKLNELHIVQSAGARVLFAHIVRLERILAERTRLLCPAQRGVATHLRLVFLHSFLKRSPCVLERAISVPSIYMHTIYDNKNPNRLYLEFL